jgi:succinate dehydrogenase / fumarate reductase cytochrome b subunit
MNKKIRPLSPHLLVYKSEFTSLLSIFHRICGSFLLFTLFSILIFFNCFYFLFTFSKAFFLFDFFVPIFNIIFIFLKIFLVFIFFFHLTNGIRHLLWDLCFYLEIKNVYLTGLIIFLISFTGFFIIV